MAEAAVANVPAKADAGEPKKPLLGLSFLENLAEMSVLRQLGLLVGLAASVAIGFAVVLWSQQPDYRPLYGSLNGMDATQVVDTLAASGIDYTIEPNSGALLGFGLSAGSNYSTFTFAYDADVRDDFVRHVARLVIRLTF
mgnify:CR=1 FL=1